ncbi:MAG: peptidase [Ferrovum sp. 37-45-19]|jgi:D-alanyl-D-alanine carboxypeptidase (penicillin-binding protein 5/6)|uniref:D-alanyl-D-alanine carboxypeptidase family protein n=1 Tax=Ferrovum sp. JA12 TaxID=1356299 RepID=UPI0007125533|nr:D-alanyl-D-alanine carboxypeptidase family protein [Ferrovum sp. JA12]OYV80532.1 MAG: peptidase [Ferrovum sp. 21-44-67]OYV94847.1 MAG: peptidase [Ferrovum sp. 37-45-19]OZB34120.1 MAG: peptidase [Ferrovum sp. 34-44-207]HQT81020.1 D-alanyl-D-alanine carboxypeptidase family protein [Ferrovaceae bacterium]KRH79255.1 D-alanyl-D-alanine carboxypeptidase DacC precursor [Ferrovum sp. JA12]
MIKAAHYIALTACFLNMTYAKADTTAQQHTNANLVAPYVAAKAYYLEEVESHQLLATLNPDERVEPASLTKLMSAYLVFDALRNHKISLTQHVSVSEHAWRAPGSRMFIEPNKPVTVDELIHGMIIQSGNDATTALAESVAGSEDAFVSRMNLTASRLGLSNTHFSNATGLPDPQHYSTARDLAKLASTLLSDFPEYLSLFSTKEYRYNNITQPNRNRLLWIDPSVDGLKTGHTESAGYCLISSAKRGQRRILSVVLGTNSDKARTSESQKLINWGFQTFESTLLFKKNTPVKVLTAYKGSLHQIQAGFNEDVWITHPAGDSTHFHELLTTFQPIIAPVMVGQNVGKLDITYNGSSIESIPLISLDSVPLGNAFTRGWDSIRLMIK